MEPIRKESPFAPFTPVPAQLFTETSLSTSELAVAYFALSRFNYKARHMMTTPAMSVSLGLGFNRRHVFKLLQAITFCPFVKKTDLVDAHVYSATNTNNTTVMVPKVIISHGELLSDEKVVLLAIHNREVLGIKTKKQLAQMVRMDPRTLAKVIDGLIADNVLKVMKGVSRIPAINIPGAWKMCQRTSLVKIYGPEWAALGKEVRGLSPEEEQPTQKTTAPVLSIVSRPIYRDTEDGFLQWAVS